MNATAVSYWGRTTPNWDDTSGTTIRIPQKPHSTEPRAPQQQHLVVVVAANNESAYTTFTPCQYRIAGLPPMSQVLLMEAPPTFRRFASGGETFTLKEIDPALWRGFFPVQPNRQILFSEMMDLRISQLRRLSPRISLDRLNIDDDA